MRVWNERNYMETNPNPTGGPSKSMLNANVEIKGTLKYAGELTFEGKLEGQLVAEGLLTAGERSVFTGDISADTIVIRGKVNGDITARNKLDLKGKAEVVGDIRAARLTIEEGVTYVGKAEVNPNKTAPPVPPGRPPEPVRAGR